MLLFRSEEHVRKWSRERARAPGAVFTPQQGWALAEAWFADRFDPAWRRMTPKEAQAVFEGIGLSGPFWDLPG
ncbi:MAG TPA: hypothetical protein VFW51_05325 [Actinomycetota bacterium]|nr:hypothetical protein [Actinomycetota bacterium]